MIGRSGSKDPDIVVYCSLPRAGTERRRLPFDSVNSLDHPSSEHDTRLNISQYRVGLDLLSLLDLAEAK